MRLLPYFFLALAGGLSLATFATSQTMGSARPTGLIAADLDVPEAVFIECFIGVSPDKSHNPTGATQRANKAILLPCLQQANPDITNNLLDNVMDRYRHDGPMRG